MLPGDATGLYGRFSFPSDPRWNGDGDGDIHCDVDGDVDSAVAQSLAFCTADMADVENPSDECWNADAGEDGEAAFFQQHPNMSSHSTIPFEDRAAWLESNSLDQIYSLPHSPTFVNPNNLCCADKRWVNDRDVGDGRVNRCVTCLVKCGECHHGDTHVDEVVPKCKFCPLAIPVIPNSCPCGSVRCCDYTIDLFIESQLCVFFTEFIQEAECQVDHKATPSCLRKPRAPASCRHLGM